MKTETALIKATFTKNWINEGRETKLKGKECWICALWTPKMPSNAGRIMVSLNPQGKYPIAVPPDCLEVDQSTNPFYSPDFK